MPDFKLSFGVDGGDSISSGSGGSIKQDLDSIVSQINSKPYEIKLEADAKSFKDELSRITDFAKSQASEIKQAYKDALKGIQFPGGSGGSGGGGGNNGGKSRNSVIKKETVAYYQALVKLEKLKGKIHDEINNWTAAEQGKSSKQYADLKAQETAVAGLIRLLEKGSLKSKKFKKDFAQINSVVAKSGVEIGINDENYNAESKSLNQAVNDIKAYYNVQKEVLKQGADLERGIDGKFYSKGGQFTTLAEELNVAEDAFIKATVAAENFSDENKKVFSDAKAEHGLDYLKALEAKQRKDKSQSDKKDAASESKSLNQAVNDIKAYYNVQKEVLKQGADLERGIDGKFYSKGGQFTTLAEELNVAEDAFIKATVAAENFSDENKKVFSDAKAEHGLDYLKALEAKQRDDTIKNTKLTEGVDGYEKALTSVNSKLIEVRKNVEAWSAASEGSTQQDYADLSKQVVELENLQGQLKRGELTAEQFAAAFSKINIVVSNSSEAIKHAGMAFEKGADVKQYHEQVEKVSNLLVKVKKNLAGWGAAKNGSSSASYIGLEKTAYELEDLRNNLLKTGVALDNFDNKFDDINYSVKRYSTDIELAGENTESAGSKIKDLAKALGISFTAMDAIHKAYEVGKKMFETVKEIDTAMTELKKVTDETDATYIRFLEDAKDRARDLGATVADTVSATADFARLGHPIDDAGALADAAIVYQNVGDGIEDITTSSESIISTMQAFGIEAKNAMSIVDSFNAVGKLILPTYAVMRLIKSGYIG